MLSCRRKQNTPDTERMLIMKIEYQYAERVENGKVKIIVEIDGVETSFEVSEFMLKNDIG